MKRLRSLGSGKSRAAEAAAKAANDNTAGPWPTVATLSEEQPSPVHMQSQPQPNNTSANTYVNFSDDEIRAMEESALEYAIQQSQQNSDRYLASSFCCAFAHLSVLAAIQLVSTVLPRMPCNFLRIGFPCMLQSV